MATDKVEIQKIEDNKFIITRTIVEEMDAVTLLATYNQIKQGKDNIDQQLLDLPVQVKSRTEVFEKERDNLQSKLDTFREYALEIEEKERQDVIQANIE